MSESIPQAGVPITEAAEQIGVTVELLRKRAQRGTIPAYKVDGRWFVVLDATAPIVQDIPAGQPVQDTTGSPGQDKPPPRAVSPAAMTQLEAIRDEWLQPLIDQIRMLEHDRGRREEQRDQAIRERDELRAEVELLRAMPRSTEDDDKFLTFPTAPTLAPFEPTTPIVASGDSPNDALAVIQRLAESELRAEAAEQETARLRAHFEAIVQDRRTASPAAPGATDPPETTPNTLSEPSVVASWLRKVFGRS